MIDIQRFKKMISKDENKLPFLTLDEFFERNSDEYAIAPNQCDEGRPSLTEMYQTFLELEKNPFVEWIRVCLHSDTQIIVKNGSEENYAEMEKGIARSSMNTMWEKLEKDTW